MVESIFCGLAAAHAAGVKFVCPLDITDLSGFYVSWLRAYFSFLFRFVSFCLERRPICSSRLLMCKGSQHRLGAARRGVYRMTEGLQLRACTALSVVTTSHNLGARYSSRA